MMSARRRIVVTGGAGFIGSTLADRLLSDGWDVTAVDSFDPFYPRPMKETTSPGRVAIPPSTSSRLIHGTEALCWRCSSAPDQR